MIWYTYELSASHLSRDTAIFVIDACQFGPSWIFGQKIELMVCASSVGGTTELSCLFLTLYVSINDMKYFWTVCITSQPCHSHFLLIAANLALAGFLGWKWSIWPVLNWLAVQHIKYFSSLHYRLVSMIWNTFELSASHLSCAIAVFVVDCCQFGPNWLFWTENWAYDLCQLGWRYNRASMSFSWP